MANTALDSPIHRMEIESAFKQLSSDEKLYAHHMARAAWFGARIVMRQVSPESEGIFDFLAELHRTCRGDWTRLLKDDVLSKDELHGLLVYAATFLSNVGNYYGSGDQKFIPSVPVDSIKRLSALSPRLGKLYEQVADSMYQLPPYALGFPSAESQSAYYPGEAWLTHDEIVKISHVLELQGVLPENTRIQKLVEGSIVRYEVLVASVDSNQSHVQLSLPDTGAEIIITHGDHAEDLKRICSALESASKYARNDMTRTLLSQYCQSFRTGDLGVYRESQKTWIADKRPRVENIFGFVEPYRDPHGVRAEFEGLVAINDPVDTQMLSKLVEHSDMIIRRLPWAQGQTENNGKGPFERVLFDPPDLSSIHALAYCSSIIFPGINLPNYNDIRDECGFKNVIVANRMSAESSRDQDCPFLKSHELAEFQRCKYPAYYWWVVMHELLGHGTGRMMVENADGSFNFDPEALPVDTVTQRPIRTWYKPGQTWTGQFEDLATTVDECRAELVGAYLMSDSDVLNLIGYDDKSDIKAEDLMYNMYQQLGVDGLYALENFNLDNKKWGQAHSRAHYSMLKCLIRDGGGCVRIECDAEARKLKVCVNRSSIISHGKPALGRMLLRLHMYRCTADVRACREYYEDLSKVDGEYLQWREIVLTNRRKRWLYCFANTFESDGAVTLRQYPATLEGIIDSWMDREL